MALEGRMTPWQQVEPSLTELFQEPIIRAIMSRDAVRQDELLRLLERLRANYAAGSLGRRAH